MNVEATPTHTDEPRVRRERAVRPVPVWLMVLLFMLLYWGALYFDQRGGWFSAKVYAPFRNLEQVQAYQIRTGGGDILELGKAVYSRTCVACHQLNGQGTPGQFPPLTGSEWVNEQEPGRIIRIVLHGMQGPITVKGQPYNNSMVAWDILSDQDIAAVLTYVRQNEQWGNNAPAVTPAHVKAVRDKAQNRPGPFTAAELLNISPAE